MDIKPLIGLAGVVAGVAFSEMNDQVVSAALPDIAGGLGIGTDLASWVRTLYLIGVVLGAVTGPTLAVAVSQRRFLLGAIAVATLSSLPLALHPGLAVLYAGRVLQGMAEGAIISNLISAALKSLPPSIRLYGLMFYAATATMIPNLAISLAALWTDVVEDWRWIFLQTAPLAALSGLLVWYGMPQEPPRYARLKTYDWTGAVLATVAFGALGVFFGEGEQFDWFNSRLMSTALLVGGVATPLFVLHELRAEQPLIGLHLLKKRNLVYPASGLILFIVLSSAGSQVPVGFLTQVQGLRPEQSQAVTVLVALAQLVLLPLAAWWLDHEHPLADARVISALGLLCILAACGLGTTIDSSWMSPQFYVIQALWAVGQPLVVMPLLMIATNALTDPADGPLGAALVNAPRAVSEAVGAGAIALLARWRGALHETRILDTLGDRRISLVRLGRLPASALHPSAGHAGPGARAVQALYAQVSRQAATLTVIDTYIGFAGLAFVVLVLAVTVPERTRPPRIELAGHS